MYKRQILCYLVTSLVQIPIISLLGCALCGLSISIMWPGMLSYTAEKYPTGGTAMFGMLAVAGDVGCSFGPWMTGIFSDAAQNSETIVKMCIRDSHKAALAPLTFFVAIELN